jgi:hypothetical protein
MITDGLLHQVLESPLLPARLEDDQIKDAMRALSQPHSPFFHQMMSELFAPSRVHLPNTTPNGNAVAAVRRLSSFTHPSFTHPVEGLAGAGGLNTALCSRLLLQSTEVMIGLSSTQVRGWPLMVPDGPLIEVMFGLSSTQRMWIADCP